MSKTNPSLHIKRLITETENVFRGKVATSTACNRLSKEIRLKTTHYISPQTLRRVFGLVKTKTTASEFTLSVLSQYCGYQDWGQFYSETENRGKALIKTDSFAKWILDFYKSPLPNLWPSPDYYMACKNIAERIIMNNSLFKKLPAQLASLPAGQILFFECFPYIDGLANGYQKHLQIYLQNRPNDLQAKIFTNCLLFLGSYLSKNENQAKKYYSIINSIPCPLPGQLHDIPTARYIGVQILFNLYNGNTDEASRWVNIGVIEYAQYYEKQEMWFCNYFLILSEHLFLAGFYAECLKLLNYVENPKWKKHFRNNPFELGFYEIAQTILAISNLKLGNRTKGIPMFKKLNTSNFAFTKSKFYNLYYLKQQLNLCSDGTNRKRLKIQTQINNLIADTRFTVFLDSD